jgi:hypothetical protein
VFLLCSSVRRRSAGGRGAEEEEGTVGVKEQVTPTPRIYTEEASFVEIVGSVPLPRPFLWHIATSRRRVVRRLP